MTKWLSTQVTQAHKQLANAEKELGDTSEVTIMNLISQFHKQQEFQSRPVSHKYSLYGFQTENLIWYYTYRVKKGPGWEIY